MLGSVSDNGHSLEECKTYLTTPGGGYTLTCWVYLIMCFETLQLINLYRFHTVANGRRPVEFTDGFIGFKKFCDESDIPFTIVSRYVHILIIFPRRFPTPDTSAPRG